MNKKRLEAKSILSSNLEEWENNYILKDELSDFQVIGNYLPNFFGYIWENPKLVSEIIMNCNVRDVRESLANLFMNNFYENILSGNYIENNLIYVLTLLIKDEINNLNNIDDFEKFMDVNSKVGYFMDELRNRKDIKSYFKTSILHFISDLESISSINFSLDVEDIIEKLDKKKTSSMDYSDISAFDQKNCIFINEKKKLDQLVAKYISALKINDIKKRISQNNDMNRDMNDYLNNIINNSKDAFDYSNLKLLEKFDLKADISDKLIFIYINKFYFIKDFIEKFISFLKLNLNVLPYSIKCFCKIINILIQKKFPDINVAKKNAFIAQFLFKKIIMPILANPGLELLINNFIISGFTLPNLNIINEVLNKLFYGKLFDYNDSNYTPFNWYILEKIPEIIEIFSKVTDIELPSFIDDLINDRLDNNFIYDYSELNKEEVIMHYSICFTYNDLRSIIYGLNKAKSKIDISSYKNGSSLLKTFEILNSEKNRNLLNVLEKKINNKSFCIAKKIDKENKELNQSLNNNIDKDVEPENDDEKEYIEINCEHFYLIQKIKINSKYKELFGLKNESKKNFNIKEIKPTTQIDPEIISKNNIIKIKNFFSDLLYNLEPLKNFNLSQISINDTIQILNSINKFSKFSNNNLNEFIPSEWYIKSIINLIKNIPEDYSKDDLDKLYNELEDEINISISNYDIDYICAYMNRLNYVKKEELYYNDIIKNLKDFELNQRVKYIVENAYIPVKIKFKYEKKNKSFKITKSKTKKEDIMKKESKEMESNSPKYKRHCHSIQSFIDNFPDFSDFQGSKGIDILELQKSLSIPHIMKEYFFSIIREYLNSEYQNEKEIDLIHIEYKIYDYVMSKINSKIFPKTLDEDNTIYKNSIMLSWIEPKHIMKEKNNYIFDAFLPDIINKFYSLENEQSPRKKMVYFNEIFELISKVVIFNGGNSKLGVDDQMPILNYCFIKAQPNRISSNIKFIQLYQESLNEKLNDNLLTQFMAMSSFIKDIDYKNIYGISKEEFISKCNEAMNSFEINSNNISM